MNGESPNAGLRGDHPPGDGAPGARIPGDGPDLSNGDLLHGDLLEGDLRSALRQLECSDPSRPRLGRAVRLADEVVRLSQSVSLGFGGQSLVSLERTSGPRPWRLHCRHPGLFGTNGPLPLHLTEEANRRARHHADPTTREFVDLFNHRLIALFYRAWADAEPAIAGDRPDENPFADMLGALGGHLEAEGRRRDALPDALRQGSAMWFGPTARSPDGLLALLRRHLGIDARVDELSGTWVPVPAASRFVLGGRARRDRARLGEHLLGRRGWCANGAFRLAVRAPTRSMFESLSRPGRAFDALADLVRAYVGDELAWELELELPTAEARPIILGSSRDRTARLGRDTWFGTARSGPCRLRLDEARRRRIRHQPRPDVVASAPDPVDDGASGSTPDPASVLDPASDVTILRVPDDASDVTTRRAPEDASDVTTRRAPDDASDVTVRRAPEDASDVTTRRASETPSDVSPDETPTIVNRESEP